MAGHDPRLRSGRHGGVLTAADALAALRSAVGRDEEDWIFALALEIRDRLRDSLRGRNGTVDGWDAPPVDPQDNWTVLVAALVGHEFDVAGLSPPGWTVGLRSTDAWVLDTPRLTEAEIRAQTPAWLAERNIFVAAKDLITL